MGEPPVIAGREEDEKERKLREWFDEQALRSPERLEGAARTILGLVTGLLGLLLGVLTVAADDVPAYMLSPVMKVAGGVGIVSLLVAIVGALGVLIPRRHDVAPGSPDEQSRVFEEILGHKDRWLTVAVYAFGGGLVALDFVLVYALFSLSR